MESIHLKILLPSRVLTERKGVTRIIAATPTGAFRILPHQANCVVALAPGVLTYEAAEEGEVNLAIDHGLLVKAGADVLVSVRDAKEGIELGKLTEALSHMLTRSEQEHTVPTVLAEMERGLTSSYVEFHQE
ncbi:MAG TPA: hypothetical protein VGC39_08650 [Candidatus Methylacidiphilales bacterium]